mgnify:CR=1 FL=1
MVCVPPHSMGSGAGTASKLKRRYTGFSSIPRGIAVPEVGVPAAVLVNAKLTARREAPPKKRRNAEGLQPSMPGAVVAGASDQPDLPADDVKVIVWRGARIYQVKDGKHRLWKEVLLHLKPIYIMLNL